jgi:hypothetical protein
MKTPVNLRLEDSTLTLLKQLTELKQTTKTAIVEIAIKLYAQQQNLYVHPLKNYAGSLSENEANDFLKTIQESRCNQNKDIVL